MKKFCGDIGTTLRALEEGTPWSNKAVLYIGLIKEAFRKDMYESNSPLCFWDYCVKRRARINNLTAKNAFRLHGSTPHTLTTCDEGDISNCVNMRGINGVTSEIKQQHFPTTRKFWKEYMSQPEEQATKWPNGYSRLIQFPPEMVENWWRYGGELVTK